MTNTSTPRVPAQFHGSGRSLGRIAQAGAVAVFAVMVLSLAACSKPVPLPDPVRSVKLITIADSALGIASEFSGTVAARVESRVGFRVSGKITKRHVEVGQHVKAGQLLATLDPQDLQLAVSASKAQVQAAQVQVDLAAADFKRFKDLRDQNFISGAELDRRETSLKAAQATLEQAKAQQALQGNQSSYSSLLAPVSGVVTAADAEVGMVVGAGTPVVRIAEDSGRDAVVAVPEDKLSYLKAGQPVELRLASDLDSRLKGTIREISAVADPATRTYQVKVGLQAANPPLGATIYAKPLALSAEAAGLSAQKLPTSALLEKNGKAKVWVFDPKSSTVASRAVDVAGADGNDAIINPGSLTGGERVVAAGVHVLQEGQKVMVWRGSDDELKTFPAPTAAKSGHDASKSVATSNSPPASASRSGAAIAGSGSK